MSLPIDPDQAPWTDEYEDRMKFEGKTSPFIAKYVPFHWEEDRDVTDEEAEQRAADLEASSEYHALNTYLENLPKDSNYSIHEELKSGEILTHETICSYEYMVNYVRTAFLPSHPPNFIITAL